eukprot:scaffold6305_cov116-Isochrysis_galbana.AAC.2
MPAGRCRTVHICMPPGGGERAGAGGGHRMPHGLREVEDAGAEGRRGAGKEVGGLARGLQEEDFLGCSARSGARSGDLALGRGDLAVPPGARWT